MASDFQLHAGDEVDCIDQVAFGTPELLLHCCVLWPVLDSCCLVSWAGLQDVLWGLWGCFAQAVRSIGHAYSVHVGSQAAVTSPQPEDGGLLLSRERVHLIFWL